MKAKQRIWGKSAKWRKVHLNMSVNLFTSQSTTLHFLSMSDFLFVFSKSFPFFNLMFFYFVGYFSFVCSCYPLSESFSVCFSLIIFLIYFPFVSCFFISSIFHYLTILFCFFSSLSFCLIYMCFSFPAFCFWVLMFLFFTSFIFISGLLSCTSWNLPLLIFYFVSINEKL